jgi:hypothetical protein
MPDKLACQTNQSIDGVRYDSITYNSEYETHTYICNCIILFVISEAWIGIVIKAEICSQSSTTQECTTNCAQQRDVAKEVHLREVKIERMMVV